MPVLVVGSVAFDSIKTPFGEKDNVLGGSAVHASVSASFFSKVELAGVVGEDFPEEHISFLKSKGIGLSALATDKGKTFRWQGYYEYDMSQAHTVQTQLNVFADFKPELPKESKNSPYVFLANMDPDLQLKILSKLSKPKLVAADTMNFWIETKKKSLFEVIKKVDVMLLNDTEARQMINTPSLVIAAKRLLGLGAKAVIIKKGEHGALYFSKDAHFSAPSYPQEYLKDPTGAGDSFAGGFVGYLAQKDDLSIETVKQAIVIGSVMASYNVEDFSLDRMRTLKKKNIVERFEEFCRFSRFERL